MSDTDCEDIFSRVYFVSEKETKSYSASTRIVKVRNIIEILGEHHIENIDFMDIDAEGFDERIVYLFVEPFLRISRVQEYISWI